MDRRLVRAATSCQQRVDLLRAEESARWSRDGEHRSVAAAGAHSAQGTERRIASLRAQLLPAVSSGRAIPAADRYLYVSRRRPLRHPRRSRVAVMEDSNDIAAYAKHSALA